MTDRGLDAAAIVDVLHRHQVEYVIIGGFGCELHRVQLPPTRDIDVCPALDEPNLHRLSAALRELGALIRSDAVEGGLPFAHDGPSLGRASMWNLVCPYGELDLTMDPSGGGYAHLVPRAVMIRFEDQTIPVAALEDIAASKRAAAREKDLRALPAITAHLHAQSRATPDPPRPRGPKP